MPVTGTDVTAQSGRARAAAENDALDPQRSVHLGQRCQPAHGCKGGLSFIKIQQDSPIGYLREDLHGPSLGALLPLTTHALGEGAGAKDEVGTPGTQCQLTELQSPRNSWELRSETGFKSNSERENKGKPD